MPRSSIITNKNLLNLELSEKGCISKPIHYCPKLFVSFVVRGIKEYEPRFLLFSNFIALVEQNTMLNFIKITDKINKTKRGKVKFSEVILNYKRSTDVFSNCSSLVDVENFFLILKYFFIFQSLDFVVYFDDDSSGNLNSVKFFIVKSSYIIDTFELGSKTKKVKSIVDDSFFLQVVFTTKSFKSHTDFNYKKFIKKLFFDNLVV